MNLRLSASGDAPAACVLDASSPSGAGLGAQRGECLPAVLLGGGKLRVLGLDLLLDRVQLGLALRDRVAGLLDARAALGQLLDDPLDLGLEFGDPLDHGVVGVLDAVEVLAAGDHVRVAGRLEDDAGGVLVAGLVDLDEQLLERCDRPLQPGLDLAQVRLLGV